MPASEPSPARIDEIPESHATGSVAKVYGSIRRVLGVPFVPMVYRVLAAEPGRLETIWADVGPNLASDPVCDAALRLVAIPPSGIVSAQPPADLGLDADAALATLRAFRHSNALNLIGLITLLEGANGPEAPDRTTSSRVPHQALLPMADLDTLPDATLALLERMSAPIADHARPIVIPSLFRCFAHDPRVLEFVWETIQPQIESAAFAAATEQIREEALAVGSAVPYRVRRAVDPKTRRIAGRFAITLPAMITVCAILETAISPPR